MGEQLYTLEEAIAVLARRTCGSYGHDYEVMTMTTVTASPSPSHVYCRRCRGTWPIVRDHADVRVDGEGQRTLPSDDIAALVRETVDLGGTVSFHAGTGIVEIRRSAAPPADDDTVWVQGTDLRDAMAKYRQREEAHAQG